MNYGPRFDEALRRFDDENSRDPNVVSVDVESQPYELLYSKWVTDWVRRLCPSPSEALLLAARCQHICRWMIPRKSHPMTRAGYLKWRADLKQFHAQKSAGILRETGYEEDVVARVGELNLKKNLASDPECQVLEDALCLVTLQHQLTDLIDKTEPDKMVGILQKTWKKMSPAARTEALALQFSERETALLQRVLA